MIVVTVYKKYFFMSLHNNYPDNKTIIDIQWLAKQIALNMQRYYAVKDKYNTDEKRQELEDFLIKRFAEVIVSLPNVDAQQYKEEFLKKVEPILYEVDLHMNLGLVNKKYREDILEKQAPGIMYSEDKKTAYFPIAIYGPPNNDEGLAQALANNYGFQLQPDNNQLIPSRVGCVKITEFYNPYFNTEILDPNSIGANKVREVMQEMRDKSALIIDVRGCPGGSPEMMRLLISYFFSEGTPINSYYTPLKALHKNTHPDVKIDPVDEFKTIKQPFKLEMPVYILINDQTFSAGESFAYAMQQMGKHNVEGKKELITLIGTKTGGGAHRPCPFPFIDYDPETQQGKINQEWYICLPFVNNINAHSETNWEDTKDGVKGVVPDPVITANQDALQVALQRIEYSQKIISDNQATLFSQPSDQVSLTKAKIKPDANNRP
ncbi:MAG: hypothetical protein A3F13_09520 [Gammaproteobacteria bacterium RIFCSPHIGHO2_12_FULL_40_19]|nr:MAG: hypothetical protein A3F13_09520 [Gammaproteobacteria bacterium RIFCSPHIGHO2_12_FULL_40_19]